MHGNPLHSFRFSILFTQLVGVDGCRSGEKQCQLPPAFQARLIMWEPCPGATGSLEVMYVTSGQGCKCGNLPCFPVEAGTGAAQNLHASGEIQPLFSHPTGVVADLQLFVVFFSPCLFGSKHFSTAGRQALHPRGGDGTWILFSSWTIHDLLLLLVEITEIGEATACFLVSVGLHMHPLDNKCVNVFSFPFITIPGARKATVMWVCGDPSTVSAIIIGALSPFMILSQG